MNKKRKWEALRTSLLTATAIMLVMSALMGTAWAYFSTYASAKGGYTLHMGHEEKVNEDFQNWQKVLNITSTPDSKPVYVRARGFCAEYPLTYSSKSNNWTQIGDYVYYMGDGKDKRYLSPGESLNPYDELDPQYPGNALLVGIGYDSSGDSEIVKDADSFNVIIVYETTEVQYDENGKPISPENADWDRKIQTYRTGSGTSATETSSSDVDAAENTEGAGGEN